MVDHAGDAVWTAIHPEAVRVYVRLVVEALRSISGAAPPLDCRARTEPRSEPRLSSEISLSTLRAFADAIDEQIAYVTRSLRQVDHSAAAVARVRTIAAEELAVCIERHIVARAPSRPATLSPAELIRRFIDMHFAEPLTLDHVAAAIGCPRSRVAATFKSDLGEAMHRYVARVRIRRAAELIVQGDKIEAAMLAVGYRSKKNFYHQFKRETGETPAAYRNGIRTPGAGARADSIAGARATTMVEPYETASGVTIARASELLGVSRRTVYNWIKQGRLRAMHQPNGARRIPLDSFSSAGAPGRPIARPPK